MASFRPDLVKYNQLEAREVLEHRLLRLLSSNMRSEVSYDLRNQSLLSKYISAEAREALKGRLFMPLSSN